MQSQSEIGKKSQQNANQHLETELLILENYQIWEI